MVNDTIEADVREPMAAADANMVRFLDELAKGVQAVKAEMSAPAAAVGAAGAAGTGGPIGGSFMSPGQFRETSLRRISLAQPAPFRQKKQEVEDPTLAKKMDELIDVTKENKTKLAVLG